MPPTLTPADIKHRQEFKDFVIAHADAVYKPILRQLYGLWEAHTKELLKEPMIPPYIMLSSPSRPQALGDFSPVSGFGGHSQIMIRPTLLTGHHKALRKGERYAKEGFSSWPTFCCTRRSTSITRRSRARPRSPTKATGPTSATLVTLCGIKSQS